MLNLASIITSTSGILGKLIILPSTITTLGRCVIGALVLSLLVLVQRRKLLISSGELRLIIITGIFLGAHWSTYFLSLQLSNVSIGIISLFTFPVITTLIEPILT